eukprot:PhM_4_TR16798/c0_g2_i1/m.50490
MDVPFYVRVWRYLYLDTVLLSDGPLTRLRKLLVAFMFITSVLYTFGVVLGIYTMLQGHVVAGALNVAVFVTSFVVVTQSWGHLKRTNSVNIQLLDLSSVCMYLIHISHVLDTPDLDCTMSSLTFFIIATISQKHFVKYFIAWWTLVLIVGYNVTIGAETKQYIAFNDRTTPPLQHFVIDRCVCVLALFFFVAFLIRKLLTELDALTRRSQTALHTTREIGAALVSYDTDAATCALAAYKANVDNDDDMCANMEQIIG